MKKNSARSNFGSGSENQKQVLSMPSVFQDKDWFETIFRNLSVGVLLTDPQEKILAVNPMACELTGYSEYELVGQSHLHLVYPDDVSIGRDLLDSLLRGERENYILERRYIRKEGRIIWGRLHVSRMRDPGRDTLWYLLKVFEDITSQKEVARALEKERDRAQQYLDLAGVLFLALDAEGKVTLANRKTCEVLGCSDEEILGADWCREFLPAPIENQVRQVRQKLIQGNGKTVEFYENPVRTRQGQIRLIAWHNVSLQDESGRVIGSLSSGLDITERKQAEKALQESEQRYHALFENTHTVMLLIDPESGAIVDANQAACSFYGYSREAFARKNILDLNILSVEEVFEELQRAKKKERRGFNFRHQLADGSLVDVEVFNGPILIQGKPLLFSIIHDITKRKQDEEQIQAYQKQLRCLSSELTLAEAREQERIAVQLHDTIGQDLALGLMKLGSIRREAFTAGVLQPLDEGMSLIEKAVHDTQTLTFDLGFITLLKRFGYERTVAQWLEKQVREAHGIQTEFADDGRAKPLTDEVRILLFEAVRELLVNVIKHAQARHVKVSVAKKDRRIEVEVQDDGIGMPPEHLREFMPRFGGGGFGLFSIRERLNHMGGELIIQSNKGRGTRVTLRAPLRQE